MQVVFCHMYIYVVDVLEGSSFDLEFGVNL